MNKFTTYAERLTYVRGLLLETLVTRGEALNASHLNADDVYLQFASTESRRIGKAVLDKLGEGVIKTRQTSGHVGLIVEFIEPSDGPKPKKNKLTTYEQRRDYLWDVLRYSTHGATIEAMELSGKRVYLSFVTQAHCRLAAAALKELGGGRLLVSEGRGGMDLTVGFVKGDPQKPKMIEITILVPKVGFENIEQNVRTQLIGYNNHMTIKTTYWRSPKKKKAK